MRDSHTAEDVTQAVFTALSKDARKVSSHPVLAGWLHKTTHHLSTNVIRSDARRRVREQQAIAMNQQAASDSGSEPLWEDIASHLDGVLGELSGPDRDAVILRYFEKRSAKEIAATLGITAEAAQKRVNRAIERLRESFARRGVTGSSAGITGAIGTKAVQAAPSGLAATIAAGVLSSSIASITTTSTAMIILQKILVPVAAVALAATWIHQNKEASKLRAEIATVPQVHAANLSAPGAGFASVSADRGETGEAVGFGGAAESSGGDNATGGGGGAMVGAGVMVDGEYFGGGPPPEPVALDKLGRPTTAMVEELELTDAEVAALETAIRQIREEATDDFLTRMKLTSPSGNEKEGFHYLYKVPSRPDQGQKFFDAFTKAFVDSIGENRGRKLRESMDEEEFLGGMGKYDLEFDFHRDPEGHVGAKAWYRKPDTQEEVMNRQSSMEAIEEDFGRVFDFLNEGGTPYPKVPIRSLPEPR